MHSMEILDRISSIAQIGHGFPRAVGIGPTFPMHQVLQTAPCVARVNDAFDFVFLFAILCDVGGTGGSHRLTREAFAIWLYAGNVDDGMNAHRAGKTEFNGVSPNQLRDGIGAEPSLRQLPGGMRETEVIGREPDPISDGVCRSV